MRKSEKNFLKHVGAEFVALRDIQEKLKLTPQDANAFADYLEKQGLIRSTIEHIYLNPMGPTAVRLVCKPIDKRLWREKYWWLISIFSAIGGGGLKAVVDWFTS